MKFFNDLGKLVTARWRKVNFEAAAFADVAARSLEEMPPAEGVNLSDIVEWVISADQLPLQDLDSDFGQPPLTVYKGRLFYIEVLFWLEGTTAIHQHGFAGAFHVAAGSSLQTRYEFHARERVNSRLLIGDVRFKSAEYLATGSTTPIEPGPRFIHAVFHLDYPTVSVVVRTPMQGEALPQYGYRPPYLALAGNVQFEQTTRLIQLIEVLRRVGHPHYLPILERIASSDDFETIFHVLDQQYFFLAADDFARLMERVRKTHGERADVLPPVFENSRRIRAINQMRHTVKDPEHRFLLALLMNLPSRDAVFDMVRARHGGDPAETIARWVRELSRQPGNWFSDPHGGGVLFDEETLALFSCLLADPSPDGALELLRRQYDGDDIDEHEADVRELCSTLKRSTILQPLFANGSSPALRGLPPVLEVAHGS